VKQITPTHFKNAIRENPAWATTLRAPVEIVGPCHLHKSPITHLSPLLHFSGLDREGNVAIFHDCVNLKVAEGTFNGGVSFEGSGIERIDAENLIVTKTNNAGWAAGFTGCKKLKVAEGTFPGWVCFAESSVIKINTAKLVISQPDHKGYAASFADCERLRIAEGTFPGIVDFSTSGVGRIDFRKLIITRAGQEGQAALFTSCKSLKVAEGRFPGAVDFCGSAVERIGDADFRLSDNPCDYAIFENTPILRDEPFKVANRLFDRLRSPRLEIIIEALTFAPETKQALENYTQAQIAARIRLKSSPSFEI
jgi:hypothetical protein